MKPVILLCLCFVGCGQFESTRVDAQLEAGYQTYLNNAPSSHHKNQLAEVVFGRVPSGSVGHCYATKSIPAAELHVHISDSFRGTEDTYTLQSIVAHELGHCLHDKQHNDSDETNIMNTTAYLNNDFWRENINLKIKEMFQ